MLKQSGSGAGMILTLIIRTLLLWIWLMTPVYAQIISDGTIGNAGKVNIPGPHYDIREEYGEQAGTNLFHSFSQFNIHTNEIADFHVSPDIQNIITRITGNSVSEINGILRSSVSGTSEISGANLYLLNPAGLIFGADASLDLGGSFHISTSDYLRMGQNERFYTIPSENEVLSAAEPTAFGFLDSAPGSISFKGKGNMMNRDWNGKDTGLIVPTGKTISVIGGDIDMRQGSSVEGFHYRENKTVGTLIAPEGDIFLASVMSSGEIIPADSGTDTSLFQNMGEITISEDSFISISGQKTGNVFIRGGQFFMDDSTIEAKILRGRENGNIDIQADNVSLTNTARISSEISEGKGENIRITASDTLSVSDSSEIITQANNGDALADSGDAGSVLIQANDILFTSGGRIHSESLNKGGKGGDVSLYASENIIFSGSGSMVSSSTFSEHGDAGNILIEAKDILFKNQGGTSSIVHKKGSGKGGDVTIRASESVNFSGTDENYSSTVYTKTYSTEENADKAGDVLIEAKQIQS